MNKKIIFILAMAGVLSLSACNKPTEKPAATSIAAKPLEVVASFSILGDVAQQIGGERVHVSTLVGADQDAHVFQPTPQDVQKVAHAQVLLSNGLGFEGWLDRLNQSASFKGIHTVASTGVTALKMVEDGVTEQDPHAWQDINNVKDFYVKNIAAALIQADPAGKDYYTQRASAYTQELAALNAHLEADFAKIPANKRKVVTSHDAFGYFGQRYGIQFLAPQGISTESEASAKNVATLIRQIKKEQVKSIFVENISNAKLIEQITKETGASMGGQLYSDALSTEKGSASTYMDMMHNNAHTILATMR